MYTSVERLYFRKLAIQKDYAHLSGSRQNSHARLLSRSPFSIDSQRPEIHAPPHTHTHTFFLVIVSVTHLYSIFQHRERLYFRSSWLLTLMGINFLPAPGVSSLQESLNPRVYRYRIVSLIKSSFQPKKKRKKSATIFFFKRVKNFPRSNYGETVGGATNR